MESLGVAWEYILVDDGSTDDSLTQARALLDDHANCHLIHYPVNRGRGYALRRGFTAASGKYVISTESDLSWGEDIIRAIYDRLVLDGCDVVVASVHLPDGGYENVPGSRRGLSYFGNIVMRWCFGGDLTMLSGMTRGYRREVIKSLHLEANHKEIHLEIIAKARALGYRIVEIPATIRWEAPKRGQSRSGVASMARFIIPHLISSYNFGAAKILLTATCVLMLLGIGLAGFGAINKLLLLTPAPMPNLITYGLVLVLLGVLCALFTGLSLQISNLSRSLTHAQCQLEQLRQRLDEDYAEPSPAEREDAPRRGSHDVEAG
ncbi:MAG: glycosyltransferase family 2 protein [Planctomycetes bacterium]|nr:glycosyltransferase family 2 protein [Planctomycetota bacterium]